MSHFGPAIGVPLPSHLFLASDGALHDTRDPAWPSNPLRRDYARHHVNIRTVAHFKSTLRAGCYAWPGGYPLYLLCDDGGALCFDCAQRNARSIIESISFARRAGWRVIACDINYEDDALHCDNCGERVEAAYE